MSGFENPERVFGVSNNDILPFDLEVTGSAFKEGRAWEGEWVERGFWWHGVCSRHCDMEVCSENDKNSNEEKYRSKVLSCKMSKRYEH